MANTTNFNWETPDDTDLVKDGAAAIRTLGSAIDTSLVDLKGGTTDQVLAKNSNADMDFKWVADATGIPATIFDAKGDLIVASAADTAARLAVGGTNGHVLTVNSGATNGIEWAAPVSSSTFVGCSITNTNTSVSIANATNTKVAMNSETFDTNGFHDNTTNNTRITIPSGKAGKYLISGSTFFSGNATGERTAYIFKNNAEVKATFTVPNATANCNVFVTAVLDLAVGDYVEFVIRQSSGGALDSQWETGQYGWFDAIYLGA